MAPRGFTLRSSWIPPALPSALSRLPASSASFSALAQARLVSFIRYVPPTMRTLLILVFTALGLTAATPPSANLIKEDIAHLVDLFSDGIAVSCPECQKVHFGKIFGNNETDAVVLFSIEGFHGGNGHSEYLAFFEALRPEATSQRKSRPYRLVVVTQIGGRWWRTFDDKPIEIGTGFVKLAGKRWQPQDAGCCPSQSFTTTFKVTEGVIIEAP